MYEGKATAAEHNTRLVTIYTRLQNANEALEKVGANFKDKANLLLGSVPEPDPGNKYPCDPRQSSALNDLDSIVDAIMVRVSVLEDVAKRFNEVV